MTAPRRESPNVIPPSDVLSMWDMKLTGEAFSYIAKQFPDLPARAVRKALEGAIPPEMADDPRLSGYRYAWVSAVAPSKPKLALTVFRMPIGMTSAAFQKGIRGIRRAVREEIPDATIIAAVIEGFGTTAEEYAAAEKMIWKRGQPGFSMDNSGFVTRLMASDLSPPTDEAAARPGP